MFKARYYKTDGSKGRARALPDALFDGVVNEGVLHQAVKVYLSNQRQGTAAAKNRSAVAGGSRKPWRQGFGWAGFKLEIVPLTGICWRVLRNFCRLFSQKVCPRRRP